MGFNRYISLNNKIYFNTKGLFFKYFNLKMEVASFFLVYFRNNSNSGWYSYHLCFLKYSQQFFENFIHYICEQKFLKKRFM